MADLHKLSVQEALNTESSAVWDQQAINTVSTSSEAIDVSKYHTVHFMTDQALLFEFGVTDNLTTGNALYVSGGDTIFSLKVPHGIGSTVYLNIQASSTNCQVRMVLS